MGNMMNGDCSIMVSPFDCKNHTGMWFGEMVTGDGTVLNTKPPVRVKAKKTFEEIMEQLQESIVGLYESIMGLMDMKKKK